MSAVHSSLPAFHCHFAPGVCPEARPSLSPEASPLGGAIVRHAPTACGAPSWVQSSHASPTAALSPYRLPCSHVIGDRHEMCFHLRSSHRRVLEVLRHFLGKTARMKDSDNPMERRETPEAGQQVSIASPFPSFLTTGTKWDTERIKQLFLHPNLQPGPLSRTTFASLTR